MFKSRSEICTVAPQHQYFGSANGFGPITLDEHHASVEVLRLSDRAPSDVVIAFDLARNAFLYSWFSYDLLMVSAPQALSTLEMALRHRLLATRAKPVNLATMIDMARTAGYLPPLAKNTLDPLHVLRQIRNDLMHGSNNQFDPNMTLAILEKTAGTINTLYPN